jgi:beta-mannosidase
MTPDGKLALDGPWQAAIADEGLRRRWLDLDDDTAGTGTDDPSAAWHEVHVPGHWRSHDAFSATDGPLLYRHRFETAGPGSGVEDRRWWLTLDGVFYQGDVWLDEAYLGDTEGYFFPHSFEVTGQITARREHLLGVEVACPPPANKAKKRAITGVFQHWDCLDPQWNPGGLWRPVQLHATGPVALRDLRVICRDATAERATLELSAALDTRVATTATVRTTVAGADLTRTHPLAAGENRVSWTITVADPPLWWPRALGEQPLVDVDVAVEAPQDPTRDGSPHQLSDRRRVRTGLRRVALRNWIWSVNGERIFVKGANQGPIRMALGEASPEDFSRDVRLALDAGLDLLRVHAHISRPELYQAADEAGLLLWQDFPLQWGYHRSIRRQAVRQAAKAVDLLGHHPSIALWCGHNEPLPLDVEPGTGADPRVVVAFARGQALPSWNRTVLDRAVKSALRAADPSRPVIAHSGALPHPPQLDGTDTHLYFGWYHGEERQIGALARAMPRLVRFVSEFGAQAVPSSDEFCEPQRWPDLDWDRLAARHALQKSQFDRYVPPERHATFASWRDATQAYQATVVRRHIEALRRLKYRPAGGFAQFCFADGFPGVTWSVLDHERVPKAGLQALADACQPVIVVADRLPPEVRHGDALALDVHVVSDLREPLEDAVVAARLSWDGEVEEWTWSGAVGADACVRVGTVSFVVPSGEGDLTLELTFTAPGHRASNSYAARRTGVWGARATGR